MFWLHMRQYSNLLRLKKTSQHVTSFMLRREPLYHKLQYSKVPKFDVAAAVLGVIVGAFVVYLSLCTLGSGGADLTDLTVVVWYLCLWTYIFYFYFLSLRSSTITTLSPHVMFVWVKEITLAVFFSIKEKILS